VAVVRNVPTCRIRLRQDGDEAGHWLPGIPFGEIDVEDSAIIVLAGGCAERRVTKGTSSDASDLRMARALVPSKDFSTWRTLAAAEVLVHWGAIERVAAELLRRRELSGNDILKLL
jgi:hypothetical protein